MDTTRRELQHVAGWILKHNENPIATLEFEHIDWPGYVFQVKEASGQLAGDSFVQELCAQMQNLTSSSGHFTLNGRDQEVQISELEFLPGYYGKSRLYIRDIRPTW